MEQMNIALAADSNYVIPTTVVMQSIFDNNKDAEIHIYLLHLQGSLKDSDLTFFEKFINKKEGWFHPLPIEEKEIEGFPATRHGKATLLRLVLPYRLKHLNKILYLDGDIVVEGNLKELYETPIDNYYIAAAKDTADVYHPGYAASLGIDKSHTYFNAGVVLMNLRALRKLDLAKEMTDFTAENYSKILAPDQDFLNFICQGQTTYFHPRYNMNYLIDRDVAYKVWGEEQVDEAKEQPAIIHFIGPVKPWSILSTHPQRDLWWKYLKETPFAQFRPKDASVRNRLKFLFLLNARRIENIFTLKQKRQIGKLMPNGLKKAIKKLLNKKA